MFLRDNSPRFFLKKKKKKSSERRLSTYWGADYHLKCLRNINMFSPFFPIKKERKEAKVLKCYMSSKHEQLRHMREVLIQVGDYLIKKNNNTNMRERLMAVGVLCAVLTCSSQTHERECKRHLDHVLQRPKKKYTNVIYIHCRRYTPTQEVITAISLWL